MWALDEADPLYQATYQQYGKRGDGTCPQGWSAYYGLPPSSECTWPDLGCGKRFRPYQRGESKVIEFIY